MPVACYTPAVMTKLNSKLLTLSLIAGLSSAPAFAQENGAPHLEKRGVTTQLIVDGKPFLMLSGELHNSSSSDLEYMKPIWPRLAATGLNSVVTPLSWELIEPEEGKYDFSLVDGLIDQAREAHERIVFLWLASWKNGMSSYAPVWVKQDSRRFARVVERGSEVEILSPLCAATRDADGRAFAALMRHIKEKDGSRHTVLMMQIENEVGVLGASRDRSVAANQEFAGLVPAELTAYLKAHRDELYPDLRELWTANGAKMAGTWTEVFGEGERADEIFMAWHYARFMQSVTVKGKAEYDIPMYVNTWLPSDNTPPGDYPSGGTQPRVIDLWRAAGSAIDFYAPDLYASNFEEWCSRFHRNGNPLYMPETRGGAPGAANVFYALGEDAGLGFSPFGIDSEAGESDPLAESYKAIAAVAPLLLEHQVKGDVHGFLLDRERSSVDFAMNGYALHVSLDSIFGNTVESGYGMIMADGKDGFLGAGKGFRVTFSPDAASGPQSGVPTDRFSSVGSEVGIGAIDEGRFEDGKWIAARRLNGDENDQGTHWRFDSHGVHTEKVTLYRFE
jgi:beta-galactosidase GanA